mgnify:CR=1 FL=1
MVGRKGYINWMGERVYLSDAFAGEPVGFERIDASAWRVHYSSFVIGRFCSADKRFI